MNTAVELALIRLWEEFGDDPFTLEEAVDTINTHTKPSVHHHWRCDTPGPIYYIGAKTLNKLVSLGLLDKKDGVFTFTATAIIFVLED